MKRITFYLSISLLLLTSNNLAAQCPYVRGAMVNACATPEGANEFVVVNSGSSGLNILSSKLEYTTAAVSWGVDGSTAGIWVAQTGTGVINNAAGTVTVLMSGNVPADKNWVILPASVSANYNLASFGTDVYVSFYDPAKAFSFASIGNFANTGSGTRTFILTAPSCTNTVTYTPASVLAGNGSGVVWNNSGSAKYLTTGCNIIALPIALNTFNGRMIGDRIQLDWQLDDAASYTKIVVEYSEDGRSFNPLGTVAILEDSREYSFTGTVNTKGSLFCRLKMVRLNGEDEHSNVLALRSADDDLSSLRLSPNPAIDHLNVQFATKTNGECHVQILQLTGKIINDQKFGLKEGVNNLTIPITDVLPGFYVLRILLGGKVLQQQWIRQ